MKTLRSEGKQFMGCTDAAEEFFHRYGEWRVVGGRVTTWHSLDGRVIVNVGGVEILDTERDTTLKLILPPEEKKGDAADLRRKLSRCHAQARDIAADASEHCGRAARYEQALREIADGSGPGTWQDVAKLRRRIAKKVLDE